MGDGKGRLKKASMGANKKVMVETEDNLAKRELVGRMEPQVSASIDISAMYWEGRFDP